MNTPSESPSDPSDHPYENLSFSYDPADPSTEDPKLKDSDKEPRLPYYKSKNGGVNGQPWAKTQNPRE